MLVSMRESKQKKRAKGDTIHFGKNILMSLQILSIKVNRCDQEQLQAIRFMNYSVTKSFSLKRQS